MSDIGDQSPFVHVHIIIYLLTTSLTASSSRFPVPWGFRTSHSIPVSSRATSAPSLLLLNITVDRPLFRHAIALSDAGLDTALLVPLPTILPILLFFT